MIEAQQKCQLCTIFITSKIKILGNGVCVYLNGYKLFFRTNKIIPKSLTGEELWYKAHDYINFNETVTLMVPGAGEDCYENFLNDGTQSTRLNDFKNNCIRIYLLRIGSRNNERFDWKCWGHCYSSQLEDLRFGLLWHGWVYVLVAISYNFSVLFVWCKFTNWIFQTIQKSFQKYRQSFSSDAYTYFRFFIG